MTAFTANAAIMPRNKFPGYSTGHRVNRLVSPDEIVQAGSTILVTEFFEDWRAVAVESGGKLKSKSHRPVNPFYHVGTGYDEYATDSPGFKYEADGDNFNLLKMETLKQNPLGAIDGARGTELNAVGRHHIGRDEADEWGDYTNFLFCDGHVVTERLLKTLENRQWGEKYYSVTGHNEVK